MSAAGQLYALPGTREAAYAAPPTAAKPEGGQVYVIPGAHEAAYDEAA